jgi:ABC-type transport system substrate-binding protein
VPPDPDAKQVAEEVRRDLARIGIAVRVRELADPLAATHDPRRRIDILLAEWGTDYPDPWDAVNVLLQPGGHVTAFPDFFPDPRWARRMRQAAATPLNRRDAVYAKLDAELARGPAPFAVLGSPPGLPQLLSARLGCERSAFGRLDLGALCLAPK